MIISQVVVNVIMILLIDLFVNEFYRFKLSVILNLNLDLLQNQCSVEWIKPES